MCRRQHRGEQRAATERAHREHAAEPVEPQARPRMPEAPAPKQHDRHVRAQIEAEVEPALDVRLQRFADRGHHFPSGVAGEAEPKRQPGDLRRGDRQPAREADRRAARHHRVVQPIVEQPVGRSPAEHEHAVREMREHHAGEQGEGDPDPSRRVRARQYLPQIAHSWSIGLQANPIETKCQAHLETRIVVQTRLASREPNWIVVQDQARRCSSAFSCACSSGGSRSNLPKCSWKWGS